MDYRDEREALRGRVENLEQDLAAAKEALHVQGDAGRAERIAEIERQMSEARGLLEKLSGELSALKHPPPEPPPPLPMRRSNGGLAWAMVALAFSGVTTLAVRVAEGPGPPVPIVPLPPLYRAPPPLEADEQAPVPDPPAPPRTVIASWEGRAIRVTGVPPVAAGRPCRVEATLRRSGSQIDVSHLDVQCGGQAIYDSRLPLDGISMNGAGVVEAAGHAARTNVYRLAYHDQGARSGRRTEISLDTDAKTAAVWRTSVPSFRVEIALPPSSEPVAADPLLGPAR